MDKSQLKALLGELLQEILEEKVEVLNQREDRVTEKKRKYTRRKKKESGTDEVPKIRRGKRHVPVKDKDFLADIELTAQEKKELALASKEDKKNKVHLPKEKNTLLSRRPSGKIEVRCRSCGKTESVSPVFLFKDEDGYRYKCNRCSCSAG